MVGDWGSRWTGRAPSTPPGLPSHDQRFEPTPTWGADVPMVFAADGAVLVALCRLRTASEHLLSFEVVGTAGVPPLGSMVDLEIEGRTYRSTVQATDGAEFVLLRPYELDLNRSI